VIAGRVARLAAGAVVAFAVGTSSAAADVIDRSPAGFTITISTPVSARPETVYGSLVGQVGEWWDEAHTYSGDSKNLSIIAEPGGCFCEALPSGGGVQHATVVNVAPGRLLRMVGGLGPLQEAGVSGALSWSFEPRGSADTVLTLTYRVGGYYAGGLDKVADVVNTVLSRQVQLLKAFSEKAAGRR
jgi:hypothetical protein